ncbi:MAG: hypothetical protein DIJKHBIC_04258 [Thermoanaerobaculia bacterium]|nr:hypothetical protein [Thermoanaerobaculia bacterium]
MGNRKPCRAHRKEYKNAMNTFTEKAMTPAHREAMDGILQSRYRQLVSGVAEARKMSEDEVRTTTDNGPYLGPGQVYSSMRHLAPFRERAERPSGAHARYLERTRAVMKKALAGEGQGGGQTESEKRTRSERPS